jgi:aspartyl protease family protein
MMRQIAMIAGVLLILSGLGARFIDKYGAHGAPRVSSAAVARSEPVSPPTNARSVVLRRGKGGHFWTEARVDGRRIEFVIDTGASAIALRESDAARIGLHPSQRDYTVKVGTANGITRAAPVRLRNVEVGDIVVRDVPALVHPDNALGVNLLGMSFLARVRWTHDRGKLVLDQ